MTNNNMAPTTRLQPRLAISQTGIPPSTTLPPRTPQPTAPILPTITTTDDQHATTNPTTNTGEPQPAVNANETVHVFKTQGTLYLVKMAVTKQLFHKYKFITNKGDLDFSTDKTSIPQLILANINVPPDPLAQIECWAQIKYFVPVYMNRKRTSVTLALRNKFKGMSTNKRTHDNNDTI